MTSAAPIAAASDFEGENMEATGCGELDVGRIMREAEILCALVDRVGTRRRDRALGAGRPPALPMRDRVRDLTHRGAGRFAHHRDQVIVLPDPVYVEAPLLHGSGGRRSGDERHDEYADRDEPVGKYQMRDPLGTAPQLAKAFHDLGEPGGDVVHHPAGVLRDGISRRAFQYFPVARHRRPRRTDHRLVDPGVEREVAECELLDAVAVLIHYPGLEEQPGRRIGPEPMAVAQSVPGLENDNLHRPAADPVLAEDTEIVVAR